jgi:molybdopterin synthase catalytic subunit
MTETMTIRVRVFAALREALGLAETIVTVRAGADVQGLLTALAAQHPQARLHDRRFGVAVNRAYAPLTTILSEGDEVALIPPVSGGAGVSPRYEITDRPLSLDDVLRRVAASDRGGVAFFAGTVRGVTRPASGSGDEIATDYLEYEAYAEMAEAALARIGAEVQARWPGVSAVSIVHRVGRLEVGDIAVIIAVAAAHRQDTFDACHYAIDRVKQIAPIWKKEVGPDGAVWVEGPESAVDG